ncbi:hypothetical protein LTR53_017913, partial [Teratosphaeriaceae sp. CCFEE 6253]
MATLPDRGARSPYEFADLINYPSSPVPVLSSPLQAPLSPRVPRRPTPPAYLSLPMEVLSSSKVYRDYVAANAHPTPPTSPPVEMTTRTPAETAALIKALHDPENGAFVNIGEGPAGVGRFEFLQEHDRQLAKRLKHNSPAHVEAARSRGLLGVGHRDMALSGPITVWYPDRQHFNPAVQPEGVGRWEFHLQRDHDLAERRLGGGSDVLLGWDLTANPNPTAQHVWDVRQAYRRLPRPVENTVDPTTGINIVWIPTNSALHEAFNFSITWRPRKPSPAENEPPAPQSASASDGRTRNLGHRLGQIDPHSGLPHQPTNRGHEPPRDQTGDANAMYHTRLIEGRTLPFTIDRCRAHPGTTQLHKTWVVTKKGEWKQWPRVAELDWSDAKFVDRLNKWREQDLGRHGWDPKRDELRTTYSDAEREWVMQRIQESSSNGVQIAMPKFVADFNERFGAQRPETGLTGLLGRLRK